MGGRERAPRLFASVNYGGGKNTAKNGGQLRAVQKRRYYAQSKTEQSAQGAAVDAH